MDVDGDGRLDALSHGAFEGTESPCHSEISHRVHGPLLLVHGLPGGRFSWDDAATHAAAKVECPERPTRIIEDDRLAGSVDAPDRRVACARLWGMSTAEIKQQIARDGPLVVHKECEPGWCPCTNGHCSDGGYLATFASAEPPLILR
ncbi:hypothetical protein [Chondromyces apiculatus]|uniref:Uncharacterized protein n=1 Tax=Chondromyces apiculatus DSM 436 TaxID=1192034 RepID=A0A017T5L7_9BACT|nr:hypothetical protein [Chondromyces apiculatus]EYF04533.1 Hypothetical protein CAP_4501 [Chondromyces apiculatus DSM 436]